MPDGSQKKISELPVAPAAHPTDLLETSQADGTGYVSRSITLAQVAAGVVAPPPAWTDITGKPTTFPPTVPIAYTDISGKPSTFPPDPEAIDDRVAALLVAGTNITLAYNDPANTLTINAAAYPTGLPPTGTAGGDLSGTYPNPTAIKASGAFAVTGALTGTSATFSTSATTPQVNAPAGANLTLQVPVGNQFLFKDASTFFGGFSATAFFPATTNTFNCGTSGNRWSGVYGVIGDFSGGLTGTTATFSGSELVGYGTAVPSSVYFGTSNATPSIQAAGTTLTTIAAHRYTGGSNGPIFNLSMSKSTVVGTQTIVAANDILGALSWNGSDGVKFVEGAYIRAEVDGTPGLDDMPTRLVFSVSPDGTATAAEAMRISNTKAVTLAGALTGTTATFSGTVSAPGAQLQMVFVETGAVATGTTVIPFDNTIPQITEGDQYMTCVITPKSATSKLIIHVTINLATSAAGVVGMIASLFQDATANALATAINTSPAPGNPCLITFRHVMTSGTTSATTFRVRAGVGGAGTTTFNGVGGGAFFGGTLASSIVIKEMA